MAEGLKPRLRLRRRRICPLGGWLIHEGGSARAEVTRK